MPYIRLPRPRACSEVQLSNGISIPDEALASRRLRIGTMGAVAPLATVARPFITTSTAAPGLPALQATASAHGARLISGGTMEEASISTGTTSFMAPTITQYLPLPLRRRCRRLPWWRRGANICHQRLAHPNERVADYYRDYCKTTVIIQQFSSPNTPKYNGLKRDGHTIMNVARCMLNGAALPKSFWGKGRPPWCFYSTARQARPTVATRRTTGCSANTYSKGKVQPGKVPNPARGQLYRENDFFPVPVRA